MPSRWTFHSIPLDAVTDTSLVAWDEKELIVSDAIVGHQLAGMAPGKAVRMEQTPPTLCTV